LLLPSKVKGQFSLTYKNPPDFHLWRVFVYCCQR